MRRAFAPALLASLLLPCGAPAFGQDYADPRDHVAPADWAGLARALAGRINAARAAGGLAPVPLSPALGEVARAHVRDLADNHPDRGACGLHSWSARGRWTPVCWTAAPGQGPAMWRKPAEVTRGAFRGYGFEIAVGGAEGGPVTPDEAIRTWMASGLHRDVILEQRAWRGRAWRAMGVGVYGGYAVAWFSDSDS